MTTTEPRVFDPEQVQHRTVTLQNVEIHSIDEGDEPSIRGYAAVFNEWADIAPGLFRERIAPGAFKRTIHNADVRALLNHDPNYVLGRNRAGTLRLREDKHGLAVEIDPPDATWSRDLLVSMKRGDISQMSFGFRPVKWTEVPAGPGEPLDVTLQEVRLFDVSVVTFPAYPQTEAWARSVIDSVRPYLLSEPDPEPNSWQEELADVQAWLESEP